MRSALAADKPAKESKQVKADLYVTATEAHALMQENPEAVLIDVRDPVEVMFTGRAEGTDIHVPWKQVDATALAPSNDKYKVTVNPDFADHVEAQLQEKGVAKDAPLIFICRSGSTRSAPAADALYDRGYTQTYTVVDGFEGGKLAEGDSKGVRAKNGWRNSGLPWTYKLDPEVAYVVEEKTTTAE